MTFVFPMDGWDLTLMNRVLDDDASAGLTLS
jgi:hypothetical protein